MVEERDEGIHKKKAKIKSEAKREEKSVKTHQESMEIEKQKMTAFSKKMGKSVKEMQADFKRHAKIIRAAALNMREEGLKNMSEKIGKFSKEIQDQVKKNKEAASHMEDNIKYFISKINKKKNEFKSYAKGPFQDYIKNFQG